MANKNRGGSTCDARHAMMLGQPESMVSPTFGMLSKIQGVLE
jgi:hypothetical protein